MEIEGNPNFIQQIESALQLLQNRAPQELNFVRKYIGIIRQSSRSGMLAYSNPPVCELANQSAFHSITWCASILVHEATHSGLYQKYKNEYRSNTLYNKWAGQEAERNANSNQLIVMEKIGSPQYDIDYMRRQDGAHADVNHDGRITNEDYRMRNW